MVLMESTYGDRDHRSHEDTIEELAGILQQAHRDGGNVLMPSFAVGRTQDLIYYLGRFYREGRLPQQAVFSTAPWPSAPMPSTHITRTNWTSTASIRP